jgi:hypothetical protein
MSHSGPQLQDKTIKKSRVAAHGVIKDVGTHLSSSRSRIVIERMGNERQRTPTVNLVQFGKHSQKSVPSQRSGLQGCLVAMDLNLIQ